MERDDGEPAAWAKDARRGGEAAFEVRDLAIHGNAERLEHVGRWVDRPPPAQLHAGDEASELVRCLEPVLRATTNDRGGHAPRLRLFAVLGEHAAEVALAPAVHDVGRRVAKVRVGTHIQRASRAKAEAALLVGELDGREPEIQKDAVDRNEVVRAGHDVAGREVRSNEARPIPEACELGGGGGETRGVDVESQETPGRNAPFEDRSAGVWRSPRSGSPTPRRGKRLGTLLSNASRPLLL